MSTTVIINSDSMGSGDAALGTKILGSFLRTLLTVEPLVDCVVLYNAGVRLLGEGSPLLEEVKALDEAGVEMLACVTCVEFFELREAMVVGEIAGMRDIVQKQLAADKVITV